MLKKYIQACQILGLMNERYIRESPFHEEIVQPPKKRTWKR